MPFFTPVIGLNIDSTTELSEMAIIVAFKETITTMQA